MTDTAQLRRFRAIQFIQQQILDLEEARDMEVEKYPADFIQLHDVDFYELQSDYTQLNLQYSMENRENKQLICQIQEIIDGCASLKDGSCCVDFSEAASEIQELLSLMCPAVDDESSGERGVQEILSSMGE